MSGEELKTIFTKVKNPKAAVLLSHGASNDLNQKLMVLTSGKFAKKSWASLRYNFGYVNNPLVKVSWEGLVADGQAALGKLEDLSGLSKFWLVGKSMGGLVSVSLAQKYPDKVLGVGIYGFPIGTYARYFKGKRELRLAQPLIVVHGQKDSGGKRVVEKVLQDEKVDNFKVFGIPGADHSLRGSEKQAVRIMVAEISSRQSLSAAAS